MNHYKCAASLPLMFVATAAAGAILAAGCSTPDAPASSSNAPATTAPTTTNATAATTTAAASAAPATTTTVPGEKPPAPLGIVNPSAGQPNHMSPEMQAQLERYKGQAANKK